MEFSYTGSEVCESELVLETSTRHEYTPEAIDLFKDFYLKL
jgi:tRNA1(Val) A37 N6-methylase TrmN6